MGDLLDVIMEYIEEMEEEEFDIFKIFIVGQLNVGKFSFMNVLLGEECNIVMDIVGIMCDFIYIYYNKFGKEFFLVDMVGICKKSKVYEDFEFYLVMCVIKVIDELDVVILMIDVMFGVEL